MYHTCPEDAICSLKALIDMTLQCIFAFVQTKYMTWTHQGTTMKQDSVIRAM